MKSSSTWTSPFTARFFNSPEFRLLLRFCAPALLIGFVLRAALTASMPHAYIQYDSSDFLATTREWFAHQRFHIHPKRSFLTPVLFTLPFVLHIKPLIVIPLAQHLLGLWGTLIVGSLVRSWFRWWKIAIVPVTVIFAASPMIVWYEHTIMGEAQYLFFTLVMVWAGTHLARHPSHSAFAFFVLSLVLVMGTRLEAKLYFAFAFMVVLFVFWGRWRPFAIYLGFLALTAGVTYWMGGKREGSGLAYATLIKLTPDHLTLEPEIEPYIIPIRDQVRKSFPTYPADLIKIDKAIQGSIEGYVSEIEPNKKKWEPMRAKILRNLCIEALRAHPVEALTLPWTKFALASDAWSAYAFDQESLGPEQQLAFTLKDWTATVIGIGLDIPNMTDEQARRWVTEHYDARKVAWFVKYQGLWNDVRIRFRLPDHQIKQWRWVHDLYGGVPNPLTTYPGLPIYFILSFLGMLAASLRPQRLGMIHAAWVITMLGGLYVVSMVAVTNARFRFVYEPFALMYFFLLFDCVADWCVSWKASRRRPTEELVLA